MRTIDCIQGTPEWHTARAGKVTASRIADLTAKTQKGWGASRANYLAELVAERLTGVVSDSFTNQAMRHGIETEPEARSAYSFITGLEVAPIGFVLHPTLDLAGASPDGLVGDDGLIEVKCPNTATHIETLLNEEVPEKYLKQMQWQMLCCDRAWCDFVSYDPRLPARMQMFVKRVARDATYAAELETVVRGFLSEVYKTVEALTNKFNLKEAA